VTAIPALRRDGLTGPALMLAGGLAIGFAPIGLRLSEFGPQATAFWRYLLALPLIWLAAKAMGARIGRPPRLALLAGAFFALDIGLFHAALLATSVANATFIVNIGNAAVGLLAWLVLKEPPGRIWAAAVTAAVAGAALLSGGAAELSAGALAGDLMALGAAVMVACYLLAAKLARREAGAMAVIFWATVAEAAVALALTLLAGERLAPARADWLLAPLALAVACQLVGQTLIVAGVGRTPAAIAGVLVLVQPVAAALVAWRLFGEELSPVQLAGAALVLAGVALAGWSQSARGVSRAGPQAAPADPGR
jgi:drug/metabolite transporter (DMT)-like permease